MANPITKLFTWVKNMFFKDYNKDIIGDMALSPAMQSCITNWMDAFYLNLNESKKYSANMAGVVSGYMATLATNEVSITCGSNTRAEYLQEQIENHLLGESIKQASELAAAGGACAIKPYVLNAEIRFDVVDATRFIPVRYIDKQVVSAIFTDVSSVKDKKFIRLERHALNGSTYTIRNDVYAETGRRAALSQVPVWEGLEEEVTIQNITRPLFGVVRTAKTNNIDGSKSPVSYYSSAMATLQRIDHLINGLDWEIETGKRKQIIDATTVDTAQLTNPYIKHLYPTDQYILLNESQSKKPYDDYTPQMRIDAFEQALNIQFRILETQVGVSTGTFNIEITSSGVKTATEVISEDRTTYNTITDFQTSGIRNGLLDVIYAMDIYATLYNLSPGGEVDPSISFGDSIFEDTATEFMRRIQMTDRGLYSDVQFVMWYFNVDEDKAKELMGEKPKILFGDNDA